MASSYGAVGQALEQAQFTRSYDRLRAILDAQFAEDVAGVPLDGVDGNDQHLSNTLVGSAGRHQLEHFEFPVTQGFDQGLRHRLWHRALAIL